MEVIAIMATGLRNELGKNNDLLWHLPKDMAYFKEVTWGSVVISGRKNYESIPEKYRPLPGRLNYVITHNAAYKAPGAEVFTSLSAALEKAKSTGKEKVFIIGGGQIYKTALENNLVDTVLLTLVEHNFDADVFLEGFNQEKWYLKSENFIPADSKNAYNLRFQTWIKPEQPIE
ncbi:MAG: dihydrofolate reductase [Luteibaculaceae bacterium]